MQAASLGDRPENSLDIMIRVWSSEDKNSNFFVGI